MGDGSLLCAVGSPPPPPRFPSQAHQAPREALFLRLAFQSLTLSSFLLQHKSKQQLHYVPPKQRLGISAKKSHEEDGNADAANFACPPVLASGLTARFLAIALFLGGPLAFFRALMSALPPDFSQRWHNFFEEHRRSEPLGHRKKRKMGIIIYDVHGEVITTVGVDCEACSLNSHGKPSDIPAFLWQAVVACEDRRFFQHCGVDPRGVARAALSLSSNGGGSSITQQLVKNVFLTSERRWTRKVIEMLLAVILEMRMSKWDLLQAYLKKIYWGHGVYGVEAASDLYFGKHLSLLKVGECAMLAGMIPAPELFSPFHDPSRGKRAQARAVRRMVEAGFLDTSYAEAVINEPLELSREDGDRVTCRAPYFVDEVLKDLKERYGCKVLEGGLKVYTTLDLRMQELAEEIVKDRVVEFDRQRISFAKMAIEQLQKKQEELQKACNIVIKKATSKIYSEQPLNQVNALKLVEKAVARIEKKISARKKALLLSLENFQKELDDAVDARLQVAMTAVDPLDGAVRVVVGGRNYLESCFNRTTKAYRPPGSTFEPIVYLTALAERISLNDTLREQFCTPAANLSKKHVIEVTPLQLAAVYSTIAAGGTHHKPFFITRVETQRGEVLEEHKSSQAVKVVDEHAASELCKILQATVRREMGQGARIRRPCAGKTGTSEGHRDVWCAGFTPDISCVVWLGYDDNSRVGGLHPGTGASHAIHVWADFLNSVYKEQPLKYLKALKMP